MRVPPQGGSGLPLPFLPQPRSCTRSCTRKRRTREELCDEELHEEELHEEELHEEELHEEEEETMNEGIAETEPSPPGSKMIRNLGRDSQTVFSADRNHNIL